MFSLIRSFSIISFACLMFSKFHSRAPRNSCRHFPVLWHYEPHKLWRKNIFTYSRLLVLWSGCCPMIYEKDFTALFVLMKLMKIEHDGDFNPYHGGCRDDTAWFWMLRIQNNLRLFVKNLMLIVICRLCWLTKQKAQKSDEWISSALLINLVRIYSIFSDLWGWLWHLTRDEKAIVRNMP